MALLLPASDQPREVTPENGRAFSLSELQTFVGGYIEVVRAPRYTGDRMFLVLNEDGKRLRLPCNLLATMLYRDACGVLDDLVVGDVILCNAIEAGEGDEEEEV